MFIKKHVLYRGTDTQRITSAAHRPRNKRSSKSTSQTQPEGHKKTSVARDYETSVDTQSYEGK